MKTNEYIIVHHTLVSRNRSNEQFDAVNAYHKRKKFPVSSSGKFCGYHYFIEPDGTVIKAREHHDVGAHCKESLMNYRSIGICLAGNFDTEEPTKKQKIALLNLIRKLQGDYGLSDNHVKYHRDFAKYKSCPGSRIPNDLFSYLEEQDTIPEWGREAMKWGVDNKITNGQRPNETLTRVEMIVMLNRLYNLMK